MEIGKIDHLSSLPVEVLENIYAFMDLKDLLALRANGSITAGSSIVAPPGT